MRLATIVRVKLKRCASPCVQERSKPIGAANLFLLARLPAKLRLIIAAPVHGPLYAVGHIRLQASFWLAQLIRQVLLDSAIRKEIRPVSASAKAAADSTNSKIGIATIFILELREKEVPNMREAATQYPVATSPTVDRLLLKITSNSGAKPS